MELKGNALGSPGFYSPVATRPPRHSILWLKVSPPSASSARLGHVCGRQRKAPRRPDHSLPDAHPPPGCPPGAPQAWDLEVHAWPHCFFPSKLCLQLPALSVPAHPPMSFLSPWNTQERNPGSSRSLPAPCQARSSKRVAVGLWGCLLAGARAGAGRTHSRTSGSPGARNEGLHSRCWAESPMSPSSLAS